MKAIPGKILVLVSALSLAGTATVRVQSPAGGQSSVTAQTPVAAAGASGEFVADWRLLFPDDPVRAKVVETCTGCHDLRWVLGTRFDESHWEDTIWTMVANGAKVSLEDVPAMAKYLAAHFGPDKKPLVVPVDLNAAPIEQLTLLPSLAPNAQAIVRAREQTPFKAVEDLLAIPGISKEAFEKAKPFVIAHTPQRRQ
jgi:hypothetical protein